MGIFRSHWTSLSLDLLICKMKIVSMSRSVWGRETRKCPIHSVWSVNNYHYFQSSALDFNLTCVRKVSCHPSFVCFSTNLHYRQHIGLSHLMLCRIRRECSSGQPCDSDHLADPWATGTPAPVPLSGLTCPSAYVPNSCFNHTSTWNGLEESQGSEYTFYVSKNRHQRALL